MIFNNYLPKFNFIFKLFLIIFCSVNLTAGYRSLMVKNLPTITSQTQQKLQITYQKITIYIYMKMVTIGDKRLQNFTLPNINLMLITKK